MSAQHKYGWIKQLPDFRDLLFAAPHSVLLSLPPSADLRGGFPEVYDQGNLGSCTANASAGLIQFDQKKQGLQVVTPSRLFDYYNSRLLENSTASDAGASIRDSLKAIAKYGFCPETDWPYDVAQFATAPPQSVYTGAVPNCITDYAAVQQTADQIKGVLASGRPITFGFTVYSSFESSHTTSTGDVTMPTRRDGTLGGHAVILCGFDDAAQMYLFRNSWGSSWGKSGYGRFPYAYVHSTQLSSDFWVVNTIPGGSPSPPPPPPTPGNLSLAMVLDGVPYSGTVTKQ